MTTRYMQGICIVLALTGNVLGACGNDLAITSFSQSNAATCRLSFDEIPYAVAYRVEYALPAIGVWTNFGHTVQGLDHIEPTGGGSIVCSVPTTGALSRIYRVVAVVDDGAPAGMVRVSGGTFSMGNVTNAAEGVADELPVHTVTVSSFFMDCHEVDISTWGTVKNWGTSHGYDFENAGSAVAVGHPVQNVSWYDAVKWCNARSQRDGRRAAYYTDAALTQVYKTDQVEEPYVDWSAQGYRLPTEAEWEYAARGGGEGRRFAWAAADINHTRANYTAVSTYPYDSSGYATATPCPAYNDGSPPYTSPVGSFPANEYGLYDMIGNVSEWCWDWYDNGYYATSPTNNPTGPAVRPLSGYRAIRGGSWSSRASGCRVAYRYTYDGPELGLETIGFRTVMCAP